MSSPHGSSANGPVGVDLASLLAPISADHPAGDSLRYQPLFDALQDLRREEDPSLPQGVWKRELKKADWGEVARLAIEALESRSKDLQLAVWLTEAWTHLHGFPGCEHGLRLLLGLVEDFWDDVHPRVEEGDLGYRLAPLQWLNEPFPQTLKGVPITRPGGEESLPYSWSDWETGLYLANLARGDREAFQRAEAEGKVTQAQFLVSVSLTPSSFYYRLSESLASLAAAEGELEEALAGRVGEEGPSLGQLREVTAAIGGFVARVLLERQEQGEPSPGAEASPVPGEGAGPAWQGLAEAPSPAAGSGRITSRAEAYRRLYEAADYLLRAEPHSPVPYLVRRAVSWGNLSLAELLSELLADNADLRTVYKLLGIRTTSPSEPIEL